MKKKIVLSLLLLVLCVLMLPSCADIMRSANKDAAIAELDKLQAQLEEMNYMVIRADEAEVIAFAESLASGEGVLLEGEVVGVLEYSSTDAESGKLFITTVIAVTDKADAKAIAKVYESESDDIGTVVKVTVKGRIITVLRG